MQNLLGYQAQPANSPLLPLSNSFRTQNAWNQMPRVVVKTEKDSPPLCSPSETEASTSTTPELHSNTPSPFHSNNTSPPPPQQQQVAVPADLINQTSKFESFREFSEIFGEWKRQHMHAFRVASSEALREPDGTVNQKFKYRYVVFHCAHYGEPRMRGVGKRPNQNYLPCGCKAMLRLNYSFHEKCLKVTTLNAVHNGHEVNLETYNRVSQKVRKSKIGLKDQKVTPYRKALQPKQEYDDDDAASTTGIAPTSPSVYNRGTPFQPVSPVQQMLAAYQMQQQQMIATYIQQQKDHLVAMHPELANHPLAALPPAIPVAAAPPAQPSPPIVNESPAPPQEEPKAAPVVVAPIPIRPEPIHVGAFSAFQSIKNEQMVNNENAPLSEILKSVQQLASQDAYRLNQLQSLVSSWQSNNQ